MNAIYQDLISRCGMTEKHLDTIAFAPLSAELAEKHAGVLALERELIKAPQIELQVEHNFCDGVYARTMTIPAGVILTSAIHKGECLFVVVSGSIMVSTDDGPKLVKQGHMSTTPAGTKRAGYTITDTVVTTFHSNPENELSPDKLWDILTIPQPDPRLYLQDFEAPEYA